MGLSWVDAFFPPSFKFLNGFDVMMSNLTLGCSSDRTPRQKREFVLIQKLRID